MLYSNKVLFNGAMALRKMNLFSVNRLALPPDCDEKKAKDLLVKVQDVLLLSGMNFGEQLAASVMCLCHHIKCSWGGQLSHEPQHLLMTPGVARKIACLMLQDAFVDHPQIGLVSDRHVGIVMYNLELTTFHPDIANFADKVAEEAERWIDSSQFKDINECFATPRQLWRNLRNQKWMKDLAKEMGCYETLRRVVHGVQSHTVKNGDNPVCCPILAAREAAYFQGPNFGKYPAASTKLENNVI